MVNQISLFHPSGNKMDNHPYRVSQLAKGFGHYLGLSSYDINRLMIGGFLHDVGKTSFGHDLFYGNGLVTSDEQDIIENHTIQGLVIIGDEIKDQQIREIILYHHERIDGQGYPFQLIGDEIPYLVKIISLCDAYDAMTENRSYKPNLSINQALEEINQCSGTQFDQSLAKKFIQFIREKNCKNLYCS
jgi:HD-GYP domain-containing protein (c-di-GMP phosphodiesterase class II)